MLVFLASVSQRVSHHCLSLLRGRRYLGTPELPESQPFGFLLLLDPAAERDGKGIQPGDPCGHQVLSAGRSGWACAAAGARGR